MNLQKRLKINVNKVKKIKQTIHLIKFYNSIITDDGKDPPPPVRKKYTSH